jgi:hypothetical protein
MPCNTHTSDPYLLTPVYCYYRPLLRFRTIGHPPTVNTTLRWIGMGAFQTLSNYILLYKLGSSIFPLDLVSLDQKLGQKHS